jgi:tellurite resistance protein TehA-like permease
MGLLILALSMLVFALNFQLLIAQSRPEIRLLLETGHYPSQVSGLLSKRFSIQFGVVLFLVFVALFALRFWQVGYFEEQGFEIKPGLDILVWMIGLAFCAVLLLLNIANIRRAVSRLT